MVYMSKWVAIVLLLFLAACIKPAAPVVVQKIVFCSDVSNVGECQGQADSFKGDTVFALWSFTNGVVGRNMGVKWLRDGQVVLQGDMNVTLAEGIMWTSLFTDGGIPSGRYTFQITDADKLLSSSSFQVQ